ncbi:hypothetical protein GCM10009678_79590 [Actinomadura kijaniata]|uniref:MinD-like ATPase involved in chromosome partitioning or flagellar assembly n=2 Tax=Actinomadura TaxID=1988 RepID=A0A7W3LI37_ACTNM|nr:TcpE family conjugal transfer membrane protein [Actinomadura namibiensis]MBA8948516.1 MinD-like ATPase involved in chromosome partitioning or flagellar assembly [Actinomadura namibiensis]
MDLPTYTNIWRIEKRLYKLYDLRLPMPLPLVQIGVFAGVFVPWIVLLRVVGIPFATPWHVLYIVPPGILTWLATRPVIEGKRLTELLLSQYRYLAEPRTWCRLTPIREPREVVVVARVWRRAEPVAVPKAEKAEKAEKKARRKKKAAALVEETPVPQGAGRLAPSPATASAPRPLTEYAAEHVAFEGTSTNVHVARERTAPAPQTAHAEVTPEHEDKRRGMPWRRGARLAEPEAAGSFTAESPYGPTPDPAVPAARPEADLQHPPATPRFEQPAQGGSTGTGKRAFASGVRRPGGSVDFWKAVAPSGQEPAPEAPATTPPPVTRPDIPQQPSDTAPDAPEPEFNGEPGDVKVAGHRNPQPSDPPEKSAQPTGPNTARPELPRPAAPESTEQDAPQTTGTPADATSPEIPQPTAQGESQPGGPQAAGVPADATPSDVPQRSEQSAAPSQEQRVAGAPADVARAEVPQPTQRPAAQGEPQPAGADATRFDIPQRSEQPAAPSQEDQRVAGAPADVARSEVPQPMQPAARERFAQGESQPTGADATRPDVPQRSEQPAAPSAADVARSEGPQSAEREGAAQGESQPGDSQVAGVPADAASPGASQPGGSSATRPDAPRSAQQPAAQAGVPADAAGSDVPERSGQPAAPSVGDRRVAGASADAARSEVPQPGGRPEEGAQRSDVNATRFDIPQRSEQPAAPPPAAAQGDGVQEGDAQGRVPPAGDRRVAGGGRPPASTRPDIPQRPQQGGDVRPPAPTRPDIPMVPGAFGKQGGGEPTRPEIPRPEQPAAGGLPPAAPPPPGQNATGRPIGRHPAGRKRGADPNTDPNAGQQGQQQDQQPKAPKPWSEGLAKPPKPARTDAMVWPPVPEPRAEGDSGGHRLPTQPEHHHPSMEPPESGDQAEVPPREGRSGPAQPVKQPPRPRPLPPPPSPPPSEPAITPPDPEHEVTGGGLRRLIHAVGGHSEADAEYEMRLQQPFHGTRHIVVLGCTGGAGQTVTTLMLGHTFAQHNGEPVVAVDVNPGPGALARRTRSETNETLTGLITRADQINSLTAMRRYTSQAKSGLDVIAAGKNPLQALDDRDYALAVRTLDRFYSVTLLDTAAAIVARVLPYADHLVLVAPASGDAPRAVAMTFEWLDGHGYADLRSRAVTVINGVSRRSMDDVEQAEAVARGRCRALVRIPWDDHLSMDRAPRNELKSLRAPTRRAYLALAGVVAGGFTVVPERYQELQQEQEATR